jgi:hypothetical protein
VFGLLKLTKDLPEERAQVQRLIEVSRSRFQRDYSFIDTLGFLEEFLEHLVEDSLSQIRVRLLPPAEKLGVKT